MTTPPRLGALSAGIRYQVRFFWRQALPMLYPKPTVAKVVVEHHGVDAVDDVVVYYTPPGVNEQGVTVGADFHQVKFHVAQSGAVDHAALLDPAWTGTKLPMLTRLAQAWASVRGNHPTARLNLVTNWPWASSCVVAPLIRDGGRLDAQFLTKGQRSDVGKARVEWQKASGLGDADFALFVQSLRFSTSSVSQDDAGLWLSDRCQLAGLIVPAPHVDHSPYDDLGTRLIESGRTEHTPDSLRALVEREGLVADQRQPFQSTFAVRSFNRFAHVPATDGAYVVDLTDLFHGRHLRAGDSWAGAIKGRLDAALQHVDGLAEPIHVALDAHLSIAWYTGYLLDPKLGKQIILRQRIKSNGIELWDVSEALKPADAGSWTTSRQAGDGQELALVLSVTHSALTDAARYVREALPSVGPIVHAELPALGSLAVRDGKHARWLIEELVRMVAPTIAEVRPARVHVFPACPASMAFLLGQEARLLGPTTVYEYDFGAAGRSYQPGMSSN